MSLFGLGACVTCMFPAGNSRLLSGRGLAGEYLMGVPAYPGGEGACADDADHVDGTFACCFSFASPLVLRFAWLRSRLLGRYGCGPAGAVGLLCS